MAKKELPFDVDKYEKLADGNPFVDGTDALANQLSHVISFQNIRDEKSVFFKAFITGYNETYSPNFNTNEVFGRTDPIYQYKNTQRKITLNFKTLASTQSEAYENLGRIQKLIQMLYPSYKSVTNALSLSEAPLVRLKVMNLLRKQASFGTLAGKSAPDFLTQYVSTAEPDNGLLGVIESCTVNHNLEGSDGVFHKTTTVAQDPDTGAPAETRAEPNTILPKFIDVSISFAPIHEETLGYNESGEIENFKSFPYGVNLFEDGAEVDIPAGVSDQVKRSRTIEQARQAVATAQQDLDRKAAKYIKLRDRMNNAEPGSNKQKRLQKRTRNMQEDGAAREGTDTRKQIDAYYEAQSNLEDLIPN